MSFEPAFNQNTREHFKKSINYPMLAERHIPKRRVQLDWQKSLQKIRDTEGTEWTGAFSELRLANIPCAASQSGVE